MLCGKIVLVKPETLSSRPVYNGRIFNVRIDSIREGDSEYEREIVEHKGSAVIVPVFEDGTVALVRQYRHPAKCELLEIPAGSLETGEDALTGAIRELEEEIGVIADHVEKLCEFYISPGFLTEKMHVFLATGLTETQQNLDDDEHVEIVRLPLAEAVQMAQRGEIEDAKTIIGLTMAAARLAA